MSKTPSIHSLNALGVWVEKIKLKKTPKLTQNIKILRRRKKLLRAARMKRNFYHIPSLFLSQPASQKHHINSRNIKFKTTVLVHGPEQVLGTTWGEKIFVQGCLPFPVGKQVEADFWGHSSRKFLGAMELL